MVEPFVQRIINEGDELGIKIEKLTRFLDNDNVVEIVGLQEFQIMERQLVHMKRCFNVLGDRLDMHVTK